MRALQNFNDTLLDFVENTRLGANTLKIGRIAVVGLIIFVGSKAAASQFLALGFKDIVFMASTALVFLAIVWRREVGIVMIVATTAFIAHYHAIPTLSLYHFMPELRWLEPWRLLLGQGIMLLMFAVIYATPDVRDIRERTATPVSAVLLFFLASILAAAIAGVAFHDVPFQQMVDAARPYSYYLTFFVVLLGLRSKASLRTLLIILLVMAVFMSVAMAVQFGVGDRVRLFIGKGVRVESFGRFAGRVLPPGQTLVWLALPVLVAVLPMRQGKGRTSLLVALGFLAMGLLLTFTRAMWMGALVGVVTMLVFGHGTERRGMVRIFVVFAAAVGLLLLLLGTISTGSENYMAYYVDRFLSTFRAESYTAQSTVGVRLDEIRTAWPRVVENPWLGIGVGGVYDYDFRWNNVLQSHEWRGVRYIHNAYMLVLCNAGAIGLTALLAMVATFLSRAWRIRMRLSDPLDRALVLGAIGSTVAVLVGSMLQPSLARPGPASLLGILWGMVEFLRWSEQRDRRPRVAGTPSRR